MSKIESYVSFAENIARDNSHGYDQIDRLGNPNYDCSGLVCKAVEQAGIPVMKAGASYTGNMLQAFKKCGFKDITSSVNLWTGYGLQRGDILLNVIHHTAIFCGNGLMVDARINEKGTVTGGKSGDQTGQEIMIHGYNNHPWTNVLRYTTEISHSGNENNGHKIDVKYQSFAKGKGWLGEIVNKNDYNGSGYSGWFGIPITGFRAKSLGDAKVAGYLEYRTHSKNNNKWYQWRRDYNKDSAGDTFSGTCSSELDMLQMRLVGISGHHVRYRVHIIDKGWYSWITDYNDDTPYGYAGNPGSIIDAIQVEII